MRIGVLTSGGDCPGLNAVIRAVVRQGIKGYGDTVIGFHDGWEGVLKKEYEELDILRLRGQLPRGGTILGTSRATPQRAENGMQIAKDNLAELDIDVMVVIGGEGSLGCALDVQNSGIVNVVGVPKTIDNDVAGTERTFGFDTAVSIASDAIDRLHTTAESHDRVIVCEVMGRHVGHIATWSGIAGGATMTLIPEEPFDIEKVAQALIRRHEMKFASIVVVAEGAVPVPGTMDMPEPQIDKYGHQRLGGIGHAVASELEHRTGFETRVTVLGHVQRGGTPTANDRVLCTRFGVEAVNAAHDGDFGSMVALRSDQIVRVKLSEALGELRGVNPQIWETAKVFFA